MFASSSDESPRGVDPRFGCRFSHTKMERWNGHMSQPRPFQAEEPDEAHEGHGEYTSCCYPSDVW